MLGFVTFILFGISLALWNQRRIAKRETFIRNYELPRGLFDNLRKRRPDLDLKACQLSANALRQFFLAYLKSGRKYVSMPSQVADDLWHEFILFTRHYDAFCKGRVRRLPASHARRVGRLRQQGRRGSAPHVVARLQGGPHQPESADAIAAVVRARCQAGCGRRLHLRARLQDRAGQAKR